VLLGNALGNQYGPERVEECGDVHVFVHPRRVAWLLLSGCCCGASVGFLVWFMWDGGCCAFLVWGDAGFKAQDAHACGPVAFHMQQSDGYGVAVHAVDLDWFFLLC